MKFFLFLTRVFIPRTKAKKALHQRRVQAALTSIVLFLLLLAMTFAAEPKIAITPFGNVGKQTAYLYTLTNSNGTQAAITDYGGIVVRLLVPDRAGKMTDIALGHDSVEGYVKDVAYLGALIGRYANRIENASFSLDGKKYQLTRNNGSHSLHGGKRGFDKVFWNVRPFFSKGDPALEMTYLSRDSEEGYPGNLAVTVVYTWTKDNALKVKFTATTDKPTIVNLTQHSYFNLAGHENGNIFDHEVTIFGDRFTPTADAKLFPTGELRSVAGTPLDFRKPHTIGERLESEDVQMQRALGYDHNFVFRKPAGKLTKLARIVEPKSGLVMEVLSTEPGMQFYTGNFLDGKIKGKGGVFYGHRSGFCMEPQHFPNSPNQPNFPSTTLRPGETYKNTIIYRFQTAAK